VLHLVVRSVILVLEGSFRPQSILLLACRQLRRPSDRIIWNILLVALPNRVLAPVMERLLLGSYLESLSGRTLALFRLQVVELGAGILSEPGNGTFVHIVVISS